MNKKIKDEEKITETLKSYPITISDWMHYLSDEITRYETAFGSSLTSVYTIVVLTVALITLFINANSLAAFLASYEISIDIRLFNNVIVGLILILIIPPVFILINSFRQKYSEKSKYKKALKLLDDILKGNIIDPETIKNEWFEGAKTSVASKL